MSSATANVAGPWPLSHLQHPEVFSALGPGPRSPSFFATSFFSLANCSKWSFMLFKDPLQTAFSFFKAISPFCAIKPMNVSDITAVR